MTAYRISRGIAAPLTVEIDGVPPCMFCGVPVTSPSMDGPLVCSRCDMGRNADGSQWTAEDFKRTREHARQQIAKWTRPPTLTVRWWRDESDRYRSRSEPKPAHGPDGFGWWSFMRVVEAAHGMQRDPELEALMRSSMPQLPPREFEKLDPAGNDPIVDIQHWFRRGYDVADKFDPDGGE